MTWFLAGVSVACAVFSVATAVRLWLCVRRLERSIRR